MADPALARFLESTAPGVHDDSGLSNWESGGYTDATVRCHERQWGVHKDILSARSEWFKAAFSSASEYAEAKNKNKVDISTTSPDEMALIIGFIYHGDRTLRDWDKSGNIFVACYWAYLWGDSYDIATLKTCALARILEEYKAVIGALQGNPGGDHADTLKRLKFIPKFFKAVGMTYTNPNPACRALANIFLDFIIRSRMQTLHIQEFASMLPTVPQFAIETTQLISEQLRFFDIIKSEPGLPEACELCHIVIEGTNRYIAHHVDEHASNSSRGKGICDICYTENGVYYGKGLVGDDSI